MKNKIGIIIISSAILGSFLIGSVAFAADSGFGNGGMGGRAPGIFGIVSAINGANLTVTSKGFGQNTTQTTYTVDATNAAVTKNGSTSSLGNVSVGDTVSVQGTVSGTNVTATTIRDGVIGRKGMRGGQNNVPKTPIIQGNGQPVVGGTVASINGTSLTITNASNVTYTVDTSGATIKKDNATSTVSNISVGDRVIVQGTVNGTSITASSIIDQGVAPSNTNSTGNNGGFFGAIRGFFHKMFGFF
jgi:hypothetical protein